MLYASSTHRAGFDAHAQFYALLAQGRYDRALALREDPKDGIGKEVFLLASVKEAGREAVLLSIRIGNPEDPKRFQKRFRLPNTIWGDSEVKHQLILKLVLWESAGHPGARRLRKLYPPLKEAPVSPRRQLLRSKTPK
jgi:hypothetical protein